MISKSREIALAYIFRKKIGYQACFTDPQGNLTTSARIVLADLKREASMFGPTTRYDNSGAVDPIATAIQEGKRQLLMHILEYVNLTDQKMFDLQHMDDDIE
jgi:hypothetical protein